MPNDPNIDIKIKLSGAGLSASELKRVTDAIDKSGTEAKKAEVHHSKLAAGLKKVAHEVPGLSYVLGALKNPFVALSAVIGLAINAVRKFSEEVEKMAQAASHFDTLNLSIRDFAEVIKGNEEDRNKFLRHLDNVATKAKDGAAHLKKLNDEIERRFEVEEAAGEQTPEAKAAREMRKREAKATALFNAGTRARELADAARLALPGAESALNQATLRKAEAQRLAAAETAMHPEAERGTLVQQIRDLEALGASVGGEERMNQVFPSSFDKLQAAREKLGMIDVGARNAAGILRGATEREAAARERVTGLRGQLETGTTQFTEFRGAATEQFEGLTRTRRETGISTSPFVPGMELQTRYEELLKKLLMITSDQQRSIDALSKKAADAAARERSNSLEIR